MRRSMYASGLGSLIIVVGGLGWAGAESPGSPVAPDIVFWSTLKAAVSEQSDRRIPPQCRTAAWVVVGQRDLPRDSIVDCEATCRVWSRCHFATDGTELGGQSRDVAADAFDGCLGVCRAAGFHDYTQYADCDEVSRVERETWILARPAEVPECQAAPSPNPDAELCDTWGRSCAHHLPASTSRLAEACRAWLSSNFEEERARRRLVLWYGDCVSTCQSLGGGPGPLCPPVAADAAALPDDEDEAVPSRVPGDQDMEVEP